MSTTVAVIGAGFSGTLLAFHLLRLCPASARIVLIERGGRFGCGQAYATGNPSHLLNVPAGRMSAFHDRPDHFLDWLRGREMAARGRAVTAPGAFVPRGTYGAYLRDLLREEVRRESPGRLLLVRGEVTALDPEGRRMHLRLDRGRTIGADLAVLTIGSPAPAPPRLADPSPLDAPSYRADPWAPDTLAGLDPSRPVLLIGSGLTAVDVVISLLDQGHAGPIHALSRRGLLPRRHGDTPLPEPEPDQAPDLPCRPVALLRALRAEARRAESAGGSWRGVVDRLRPFTQDLWQCASHADKARFLRHLRPWWEVHRHRMAGPVADRIEAARASGQLTIHAGRLDALRQGADDGMVEVRFRRRGTAEGVALTVARVVNCSGPGADDDRVGHPLVRHLLGSGAARSDPHRLGLDVTGNCALVSRDGAISRRLFALGPMTKGAFWEMTAVPDIRRQCELLARNVAAAIRPAAIPRPAPAGGAMPQAALPGS